MNTRRYTFIPVTGALLALTLAAGCRSGPGPREITADHFFPAPPELPRVQYLRAFNGSVDFQVRRPFLEYLAGAEQPLDYELKKPFSVATWKGRIYVTDSFGLQGVNVFDLENRRFYILGQQRGGGELRKPLHVFVDDEGYKYISDLQKRQVVVYDADDNHVRSYGDGQSFLPVSSVTHENELFVLDITKDPLEVENPDAADEMRRDQILVLDKATGEPLRRIGRHGGGETGFSFASFMTVDRLGNLYVSDFLNYRIIKMDAEGKVYAAFGRQGDRAGDFAQMKGIAVDRKGLIWVVDAAFQAVQVFDNAGLPLFAVGGPRAPQGPMDLPAGIWIDYRNIDYFRDYLDPDFEPEYLVFVANQLSNHHRVSVYAYGKRKGAPYPSESELANLEYPRPPLWTMPVFPPEMTSAEIEAHPPAPTTRKGGLSSR